MADEDNVDDGLGEEEGGSAAPAKKGGIGGLLPTLLKYIALALGAIILIVTVVIITMNIMGSNKPSQAAIPVSEDYKEIAEELEWYTSLKRPDSGQRCGEHFLGLQKRRQGHIDRNHGPENSDPRLYEKLFCGQDRRGVDSSKRREN